MTIIDSIRAFLFGSSAEDVKEAELQARLDMLLLKCKMRFAPAVLNDYIGRNQSGVYHARLDNNREGVIGAGSVDSKSFVKSHGFSDPELYITNPNLHGAQQISSVDLFPTNMCSDNFSSLKNQHNFDFEDDSNSVTGSMNPASGLPMLNGIDTAGNAFGVGSNWD